MTGEIFELLCAHSMLGRLMSPAREPDPHAFAQGVIHAKRDGDLLHHLFAVRTLGLFDVLSREQLRSFLSGLLIGHELNDLPADCGTVHLIGRDCHGGQRGAHFNRQADQVDEPARITLIVLGAHGEAGDVQRVQ